MNICPNCGGDIDVLEEMFPDGWTTCEELELTEEADNGDTPSG